MKITRKNSYSRNSTDSADFKKFELANTQLDPSQECQVRKQASMPIFPGFKTKTSL